MDFLKKGLTGYQIKLLAMIFMLEDHLNIYLGEALHWPAWVSFLGRFVAPAFVFLLVEGSYHIKSPHNIMNEKKAFVNCLTGIYLFRNPPVT